MDKNIEVQVLEFNNSKIHVIIKNGKKYYDYFEMVYSLTYDKATAITTMLAYDKYEFFKSYREKYFTGFDNLDYIKSRVLAITEKGVKRFLEKFNKYPYSKELYEFIFKKSPFCYSSYKAPKVNHIF